MLLSISLEVILNLRWVAGVDKRSCENLCVFPRKYNELKGCYQPALVYMQLSHSVSGPFAVSGNSAINFIRTKVCPKPQLIFCVHHRSDSIFCQLIILSARLRDLAKTGEQRLLIPYYGQVLFLKQVIVCLWICTAGLSSETSLLCLIHDECQSLGSLTPAVKIINGKKTVST